MSILAEIIQLRASAAKQAAQPKTGPVLPVINAGAKDPICGMNVDRAKTKYKTEFQGKILLLLLRQMQTNL